MTTLAFSAVLTYVLIVLVTLYGYVSNIISIFQSSFSDFTFLLLARLLGLVFFPVGAILGLM